MLSGVGDASEGEWIDEAITPEGLDVVHLKRRLSKGEASQVGPVIDYRNTRQHEIWAHQAQRYGVPLQFALDER